MADQHAIRHPARHGESARAAQQSHSAGLKERIQPLLRFWQKLSNDWVFNLSGLLAYNFLMSIFPILLALLAIAGFVLNVVSPGSQEALARSVANALPGGTSGTGGVVVRVALDNLRRQAGLLFVIGLVTSIFTGSRLFVTLENCFGVIFRLRGRDLIRQNLMAIGMLLLYMVLVPIVFLASIAPTAILNSIQGGGGTIAGGLLLHAVGLLVSFIVGLVLFAAIYIVVPNRPVHLYEIWKGTLLAAGLLALYELLFPIYESLALRPSSYGSVAAFAIVILVFFYYLAVILLIGAEFNSWASGQRETASDIAAILHEIQAHNTTRGAAGPTAGEPAEDLQHGKGEPAMATLTRAKEHEHDDHHVDMQPETLRPGSVDPNRASGVSGNAPGDQGARNTRNAANAANAGSTGSADDAQDAEDSHAAPFSHEVAGPLAHWTVSAPATRQEQRLAPPDAWVRRRQTQRALGIAIGAGVAAFALWLGGRGR